MRRVLVAYASTRGSTREVAEAIAAVLAEDGLEVDVRAAADVHDLDECSGVVLGGALYMGRLHRDARRFLARHRDALGAVPFGVFALGPKTTTAEDVSGSRAQLDRALARAPEIAPAAVAVFGGVIDPSALRFPFNRMPASDARDWDAIRSWAREFSAAIVTRAG